MPRNPVLRGMDYLKRSSAEIRANYGGIASRTLHLAGLTGLGSIVLGLGKIVSGLLSMSVFVFVNGCYTLGMVLARYCALAGAMRSNSAQEQGRYCRWSGIILIGSSLLYVAYSIQTYFHPKVVSYHEYIALAIAAFTFTEIGLNLRGMLMFRKNHSPVLHAIKTIHLAASLISLVLTQTAILAFADEERNPSADGILGALMGACAALLGVYMLRRIHRMEKAAGCRREGRKLRRLGRSMGLEGTIAPVTKQMLERGAEQIVIRIETPVSAPDWEPLQAEAARRHQLLLILQTEKGVAEP